MPFDTKQRLTFDHGAGVLTHGGSLANTTGLEKADSFSINEKIITYMIESE